MVSDGRGRLYNIVPSPEKFNDTIERRLYISITAAGGYVKWCINGNSG